MTDRTDSVRDVVVEWEAQQKELASRTSDLADGDMGAADLSRLDLGPDPAASTISDALASQAGSYVRWGFFYKEAQEVHAELGDDFEIWWSKVYAEAREGLPASAAEGRVKAQILAIQQSLKIIIIVHSQISRPAFPVAPFSQPA